MLDSIVERKAAISLRKEREAIEDFLERQGIRYENDIEYTMVIEVGGELAATGSLNRNVLKCIAVSEDFRSQGLTNKVVSHLVGEAYSRGETHLFVYTKPENEIQFSQLGFYRIALLENEVLLMENKAGGIESYIEELSGRKMDGEPIGTIVVNCNPFTKGHLYLIEKAASECKWLHVFVVQEGKSVFPTEVRYRLVKDGTSHIPNLIVHRGGEYIISSATFPSYFLKEEQDSVAIHARLDLTVFGTYIAPALGITRRYAGEEPYCHVTSRYNDTMKKVLPMFGIEVREIPRKEQEGEAISASRVRRLLKRDDYKAIKTMVPETTFEFLKTHEGKKIADEIKKSSNRH